MAFSYFAPSAHANPSGGTVTTGSASIVTSGNLLDVNQSTQRAVIDWRSFNIAPNETTKFNQPSSSSVTLNRINDPDPSQILGTLTANGNVILINPNGVFFGPGSQVDVNGLIATTANIRNSDFMAGNMNFGIPGNPNAAIVNQGTITAKDAGMVGLVAPNVINSGTINTRLGHTDLGSGDTFTMDMYGDGLIEVGVSDAVKKQVIQNTGTINAAGGTIQVTAAAGRQVVDSLVTISGQLNAPTAQQKNGTIIISAAGSKGTSKTGSSTVVVSGALNASGYGASQTGGSINVTGDSVTLTSGAVVNASGSAGGGTVNIGGDLHGQGPLTNAVTTNVSSGAQVKANAVTSGNGGHVVIWSDQETTVNGAVEAEGGSESGNGGLVETSSHGVLNVSTAADTSAPHGTGGEWLLDPASVNITNGSDADIIGCPSCVPDGTVATSTLSTTTIDTALNAGTNVTVTTGGDSFANAGDITVSNAISTTGAGSLTLSSYHDIIVNAGIALAGGALTLRADNAGSAAGGYIDITAALSTNGGNITMGGGSGTITAGSGYAVGSAAVDGDAAQAVGVFDSGVAVSAGGGNIIINGQGYNTATDDNYGVQINGGSISTTGAGTISISGLGSGNTNSGTDIGVYVNGGVVSTVNGNLSVTAQGGGAGTGGDNYGLYLTGTGGTIKTSGAGNVSVLATGGAGTGGINEGVIIDLGTFVTGGGTVSINATGGVSSGGATYNDGLDIFGSISGSAVSVTGTGGIDPGNGGNWGIYLSVGSITGSGGPVSITGIGGTGGGGDQLGVFVGGAITGNGGAISVTGTGGNDTGSGNAGVQVSSGSITNTGAGTIAISGTGNGTGNNGQDYGVEMDTVGVVSTVNGNLTVTAQGGGAGSGTQNYGLYVMPGTGSTMVTTGSGNISVSALGGNGGGGTNTGAVIAPANGIQTSGSGNVTVMANTLTLNAANNINSIGNLTIEPITAGTTIGVGTGLGTLSVNDADLTWGQTLTIGNSSAGNMDIAPTASFANPADFLAGAGNITLDGTVTSTSGASITTILLDSGQNFINNVGAAAINPGTNGRWLSYSTNPADDTINSLSSSFRRFDCTYGGSCPAFPATGDGFLYSYQPLLTATPAPIAVTYGSATPSLTGYGYTLSGYLGTDALADSVNGALNGSTAYTPASSVGTYNINYLSGSLASAMGYAITYANNASGIVVNPAALTITANTFGKTYGTTYTFAGTEFTDSGLVNGNTVTSVSLASLGAAATATVAGSPYAITGSAAVGTGLGNYTITYVAGGFTVNPAALTITANSFGKTYGTTYSFLGSEFTDTGLLNGDTVSSLSLASAGTPATATVAGGPYAIIGSAAVGTGLSNYTVTYNNGLLTVNPAALTITANSLGKTYGTTYSFLGSEFTDTGLLNGDTVSGLNLSSAGAAGTATVAGGPYAITGSAATGTGLSNYTITYNGGTLTVNPAALTITANSFGKTYGTTYSFLGNEFTDAGLVNGDSVSGLTLSSAGAAGTATVAGGPYAISGSAATGTGLSNYTISYNNGLLTVNPAALTITANSFGKTYGTTYSFLGNEFTDTGLVNGDTVSNVNLASAGAAGTATVAGGPYAISASGAAGGGLSNYTITYNGGTLTVNPAALTITADSFGKTYGTTYSFLGSEFTDAGLVNGDTVGSVALASAGATGTATVTGGPYAITGSAASGTGLSNYTISYVNGALTVNAAALTITANSFGKTYVTTYSFLGSEFTDTGLVNGDTVSNVNLTSPGAAGTATVAGGPYAITGSAATGSGLGNYTISYVNGNLTVNPAALTITANSFGKPYGNTYTFAGNEFTDTGLVNGDAVSGITLSSPGAAPTATVAGGPYSITGSAATGSGLGNYTISYVNGNLTVNPAALTITANSFGKTYGTTYSFLGTEFTDAGLVNGDSVSGLTLSSAGAAATATVAGGPYAISGSGAVGTGLSNYTVTYNNGLLTVNPAALTITANSFGKTYGTTYSFLGSEFTDTGLVNGDTVSNVNLASAGAPATATVAGGPYAISASGAAGSGLSNYTITYNGGTLTVNPAALTITANSFGKTYGTTYSFLGSEFTDAGLVNSDTITGLTLSSAGATATATVTGGPYAITGSAAAGTGLGNYTVTYVNGQLTVNPAALTITANSFGKTYGTTYSFLGSEFTDAGLVNGDTVSNVNLTSPGAAGTATVAGGPYAITGSAATGSGLGNYTISYVNGNLTVNPAALTITANSFGKTYGTTYSFLGNEFTDTGLVNGNTVTSLTLASVGAAGTATVAGGPYTISGSGAVGMGLSNYSITYNNGHLTVTPYSLTVTADALSKIYGASDPALTYLFGALQNGDTASVFTGGLTRVVGQNVGTYAIDKGTLSAGANYTISYTGNNLTITPYSLAVTANTQSKVYGSPAALTYIYGALQNGDMDSVFTGSLSVASQNVGTYAITQGTLGAGANYTIGYTGNNLTITPAALTITADNLIKAYGTAHNFLGNEFSTAGLVNGDTVSNVTLSSPGAAAAAVAGSPYAITASNATGTGLSNYTVSYVNGLLIVVPVSVAPVVPFSIPNTVAWALPNASGAACNSLFDSCMPERAQDAFANEPKDMLDIRISPELAAMLSY